MEVLCTIVLSLLLCQQVTALRSISEEEFASFPLLNHFDRYADCTAEKSGAFCMANVRLVTDQPSELYDKVMNFSFSAPRHFDYTKIRRGYCMTRRCKEFLAGDSEEALHTALGACLNSTLQREYGLQAQVDRAYCYRHGDRPSFNWLDGAAVALYIGLIVLVVAGTLYDLFATTKDKKGYLMCFSIPANWAKLVAPWPQDDAMFRLRGINGVRLFTSVATLAIHAGIPMVQTVANMYQFESYVESDDFQIAGNGHIIVQTFIFLTGLFLAYTALASAERRPMTWGSLPKTILLRWLRLAPVYLIVILYTATLFKYIPYGPMWQDFVGDEAQDCQQNWLSMVFFYNNYVYGSQCNPHHWSTAVDMHLHVVGLVVLLLPECVRAAVLALLVAAGMASAGLETYIRDIDGAIVMSGKNTHTQKAFDAYHSFNYLHKRSHNNMSSYFIGMAFGVFLYRWMKKPIDNSKYKKYWWIHWVTLSLSLLLIYSHKYLLLVEGERRSVPVRLLYAIFPKAIWGVILAATVFGMVCQVDNGVHRLLAWPGWVPLARLTYCSHNLHTVVLRWLFATDTQLLHFDNLHVATKTVGFVVISFLLAVPLWLVVEAPINNVVRKLFPEKKSILEVKSTPSKTE